MRTPTAASIFMGGPLDDILEKPASTVDGKSKSTDIRDILQGLANDTVDAIRSTPKIAAEVARMATEARSGRLTKTDALLRATQVLGGRGGVLGKLGTNTRDAIFSTLGVGAEKQGQIMSVLGDAVSVARTSDIRGANNIIDILGRITGSSDAAKLLDMEAEAAVLSGILDEAIRYGLPDAVDEIMRSASDDRIRYAMADNNLATAVWSSDIKVMTSIIRALGAEQARAKYPNFVPDFLMGYRFPVDAKVTDYPTIKTQMINLFVSIDPRWDVDLYGSQWIKSIEPFVGASADAITLFTSDNQYYRQATIAQRVEKIAVTAWIKDNYKYFPG